MHSFTGLLNKFDRLCTNRPPVFLSASLHIKHNSKRQRYEKKDSRRLFILCTDTRTIEPFPMVSAPIVLSSNSTFRFFSSSFSSLFRPARPQSYPFLSTIVSLVQASLYFLFPFFYFRWCVSLGTGAMSSPFVSNTFEFANL